MSSNNPLLNYIKRKGTTVNTSNLVVDQVYAVTGVIDTISDKNKTQYFDPNSNQVLVSNPVQLSTTHKDTVWTSPGVVDDVSNTQYELTFSFNQITYINKVSFDLLSVPCQWFLYQGASVSNGTLVGQGIIVDYNTNEFTHQTVNLDSTLQFNSSTPLYLVLVKTPTGTQYNFAVKNFLVKLEVVSPRDLVVNGSNISTFSTISRLGFPEKYVAQEYGFNNALDSSNSSFWKCEPQPVGDSIVNFTLDLTNYSIDNNLLSDTNTVFTNSVGNWTGGSNFTSSVATTSGVWGVGGTSVTTTFSGVNSDSWISCYQKVTATSGGQYSATVFVNPTTTIASGWLNLAYFKSDNTFIADSGGTKITNIPANQWTALTITGSTAPALTDYLNLQVRANITSSGQKMLLGSPGVVSGTSVGVTAYPQTINRLYLDPLYSNVPFNLYSSYDNSVWAPVQRDFVLRKGIYELPTINTRYLKFEFTQLVPEPYQLPVNNVEREVQVFPNWVEEYFTGIESSIPDIANQTYSQTSQANTTVNYNTQLSNNTLAGTATNSLSNSWGSSSSSISPNANLYNTITDPTNSYRTVQSVNKQGSTYTPVSSVPFMARRFPFTGTHEYKNLTINHTWHQAYFVGLKDVRVYQTNYTPQMDYLDFTDYLLSSGTNSLVYSGTTATFNPLTLVQYSNGNTQITSTSGGGYTGLAGNQIFTNNLKTINQFNAFKIAVFNTDWQGFLSNAETTLQGPTLDSLLITTSNVSGTTKLIGGDNYDIFEIIPSGNSISYVQSRQGGSTNLLTSNEANMVLVSGWTVTSGATTTYSGVTPVTLPNNAVVGWNSNYGSPDFGGANYGGLSQLSAAVNGTYTFLVTTTGVGTLTPQVFYTTTTGTVTYSGTAVSISGSNPTTVLYSTNQPTGGTVVNFKILTSGTVTPTQAGYFLGTSPTWTAPLRFSGMRISAVARLYLPSTNYGTYRCSLLGTDSTNTQIELASRQLSNLPTNTWVDFQVPFTLTNSTYSKFSVRVTQTNGQGEHYQLALLGVFYNPVAIEYCSDGTAASDPANSGNWNWVTAGVNDPDALITLRNDSNQLQLRYTLLQDGTDVFAMSIVPNYTQNPFYSTTPVQYIGDSKSNELSWRRTPQQRPLFQRDDYLYPSQYDIGVMMGISNPYSTS